MLDVLCRVFGTMLAALVVYLPCGIVALPLFLISMPVYLCGAWGLSLAVGFWASGKLLDF